MHLPISFSSFFPGKITSSEVRNIFKSYGNQAISDKEAKEILCNVSQTDKECSLDLHRFIQVNNNFLLHFVIKFIADNYTQFSCIYKIRVSLERYFFVCIYL